MEENLSIGIDLGTTFCCVGIYRNGRVEIIPNEMGNKITPSYISFTDNDRLIGEAAVEQLESNAQNTIFDVKRLIGRSFDDSIIQQDLKHWPFKIVKNNDDTIVINATFRKELAKFSPEELSAMLLLKMKETAERYTGTKIKKAVITVPAYFNDSQRNATFNAAKIAGLEVLRIINEPTAAAIAYGFDRLEEKNILIFDLGGGTLDCSILCIDDGFFEVKATSGDTHLGGCDFDNKLVVFCLKEFLKQNGDLVPKDIVTNKRILRKLRSSCELAKKNLSSNKSTIIEIDCLHEGKDFRFQLTRAKFEQLCHDDFQKCLIPLERVIKDSSLEKEDIDEVILVGGSTRIPKISDIISQFFNGKQPNNHINPDEAVAYGAALHAAMLSGQFKNDSKISSLVLVDVTPLSLGIETSGGIMTKLIERNSVIPCNREQVFSTFSDNQPVVTIKIYEGERELTKYNNLLGSFDVIGLPPELRGTLKIHVKFELDNNGILQVSAIEESKGISKKITIVRGNKLSPEGLGRMIEEAKRFEDEDRTIKDNIQARNDFENRLYNLRNKFDDQLFKEKLGDSNLQKFNDFIQEALSWLNSNSNLTKNQCNSRQKIFEDTVSQIMNSIYN